MAQRQKSKVDQWLDWTQDMFEKLEGHKQRPELDRLET
jgi:hypothetical protein